jgi:chorismate mutase
MQNAGIQNIAAIHRGFSSFEKTNYRNAPLWQLAIEFRRELPNLPLICDPSHIAGKSELIAEVSQMALDLDVAGLMIETHPTPAEAWSDARQQITPQALTQLLNELIIKKPESSDIDFCLKLEELRSRIDGLDESLLQLLAERMEIVSEIGIYKHNYGVTLLQLRRWADLLAQRIAQGQKVGLPESLVKQLYMLLHEASLQAQKTSAKEKV